MLVIAHPLSVVWYLSSIFLASLLRESRRRYMSSGKACLSSEIMSLYVKLMGEKIGRRTHTPYVGVYFIKTRISIYRSGSITGFQRNWSMRYSQMSRGWIASKVVILWSFSHYSFKQWLKWLRSLSLIKVTKSKMSCLIRWGSKFMLKFEAN